MNKLRIIRRYLISKKAYTQNDIVRLKPQLAQAAQKAYDYWDEDYAEELGGGGICQDIADNIAGVLNEHGIEAGAVSASVGDQHVFTVAQVEEGIFVVDINPHLYERGGGYNWNKIPGIKFSPNDIYIYKINDDPTKFREIIEEQ